MQSESQTPTYLPNTIKSPQARPFVKPNSIATGPIKSTHRQRRNERQQLLYYLEEIVDVQEMLFSLSTASPDSVVRQDFDLGLRGAPQLIPSEIQILTTCHRLITSPNRPKTVVDLILNAPNAANLKAAEHFKWLLEGRKMLAEGTNFSYYEAKSLISRILRSRYFSLARLKNTNTKSEVTFNDIQVGPKQPVQTNKLLLAANSEGINNLLVNISA